MEGEEMGCLDGWGGMLGKKSRELEFKVRKKMVEKEGLG